MNEIFVPVQERPTTQAADGLPRWRWTVAEVEKLTAARFFHPDERFELLGGEIVPKPRRCRREEIVREELAFCSARRAPEHVLVASLPQFNLSHDTFMLPDLLVHPRKIKTYDLQGGEALLVVEVAETSLDYDLKTKVPLYATHGHQCKDADDHSASAALGKWLCVHRRASGRRVARAVTGAGACDVAECT